MSLANILKTPTSAPSITSAYADSGGGGTPATSTEIFNTPTIPSNTYTFISPTTGSYIIEMTFTCSTGVITAPAGSYAGYFVPVLGNLNDYGATISGSSLTPAVAPLTIISFTITSTQDFIGGASNPITVYNNGINLAIGGGCTMEVTGPL